MGTRFMSRFRWKAPGQRGPIALVVVRRIDLDSCPHTRHRDAKATGTSCASSTSPPQGEENVVFKGGVLGAALMAIGSRFDSDIGPVSDRMRAPRKKEKPRWPFITWRSSATT